MILDRTIDWYKRNFLQIACFWMRERAWVGASRDKINSNQTSDLVFSHAEKCWISCANVDENCFVRTANGQLKRVKSDEPNVKHTQFTSTRWTSVHSWTTRCTSGGTCHSNVWNYRGMSCTSNRLSDISNPIFHMDTLLFLCYRCKSITLKWL